VDMSDEDWSNSETRSLGVFYAGEGLDDVDENGDCLKDDDMLLLVNSYSKPIDFSLPFEKDERPWQLLIDTDNDAAEELKKSGEQTTLAPASLKLLTRSRRT